MSKTQQTSSTVASLGSTNRVESRVAESELAPSMEFLRDNMAVDTEGGTSCLAEWSNDNFHVAPGVVPESQRFDGYWAGDDDNDTNELAVQCRTALDSPEGMERSFGVEGLHQILTADQDWVNENPDRGNGARVDRAELGVMYRQTEQVDDGSFSFGVGGGAQFLGDAKGRDIQDQFHSLFGGRRGDALQKDYQGSSLQPYVAGGVERSWDLGSGLSAYGGAAGKLPLGQDGYGWGEVEAGIRGSWDMGPVDPYFDASVSAGGSMAPDFMNFNDQYNQGYAGFDVSGGIQSDYGSLGYGLSFGGQHGDTVARISASGPNLLDLKRGVDTSD